MFCDSIQLAAVTGLSLWSVASVKLIVAGVEAESSGPVLDGWLHGQ